MKRITVLILSFMILLTGCSQIENEKSYTQEDLIEVLYDGKINKKDYLSIQLVENEDQYDQLMDTLEVMKIDDRKVEKIYRLNSFGDFEFICVYYNNIYENHPGTMMSYDLLLTAEQDGSWYNVNTLDSFNQDDASFIMEQMQTAFSEILQMDQLQIMMNNQKLFMEENRLFAEEMARNMEAFTQTQLQDMDNQQRMFDQQNQSMEMHNQMILP